MTNLTPFEESTIRAATIGLRLAEALVVSRMITTAHRQEQQMRIAGLGMPPLSETLVIGMTWNEVGGFTQGEA